MISHEDLIDSVTAEIEAIIQEEINSQNSSSPIELPVAEPVADITEAEVVPTVEAIKVVQEEIITETTLQQTESIDTIDTDTIDTEAIYTENIDTEAIDTTETENTEAPLNEVEATTETVNPVDTVVEVGNDQCDEFVEYTVKITSPTQEEKLPALTLTEVIENVSPAFTTIESILNDAPVDEKDGPRAKHLKQALRKALNNTAKSCSGDKLESCFPFNLKANQFSQINSTIINALKSVIDGVQEPFDEFLQSENLVEKLNKVDEFTRSRVPGTCEASEAAILASLTPQNLIDRKLYTSKLAALGKLEQFTQKLELENSQLSSKLNNRQTEFADRLDRLKSSQQLLDAALDQISSISMDDLEVLVDKMNHQYQPSALKFHN